MVDTIHEIVAESVVTLSVRRSTGGSGDAVPKGRYTLISKVIRDLEILRKMEGLTSNIDEM